MLVEKWSQQKKHGFEQNTWRIWAESVFISKCTLFGFWRRLRSFFRFWRQSWRTQMHLKQPFYFERRLPLKQANNWRHHAKSPRLKSMLEKHLQNDLRHLRKRSPIVQEQHHFNLTLWRSSVWYAVVQLGTPAQAFKVICDTGSADFVRKTRFSVSLINILFHK